MTVTWVYEILRTVERDINTQTIGTKTMNVDKCRSYLTEEGLQKAITKKFGENTQYITVCNRQGRFTAIFGYGMNPDILPIHIVHAGFIVTN